MVTAFIGTMIVAGFDWAPPGWMVCDGSMLQIRDQTPLYSLLGTTYGGNGQTTFGLPDLRGKGPGGIGHFLICVDGIFPFASVNREDDGSGKVTPA